MFCLKNFDLCNFAEHFLIGREIYYEVGSGMPCKVGIGSGAFALNQDLFNSADKSPEPSALDTILKFLQLLESFSLDGVRN